MITLYSASSNDLRFLFELRNLESNRVFFRNSGPIIWEDHVQWFSKFILNQENRIYIFKDNDIQIGQFRVDSDGDVSVSLKEESKGKGYGFQIIKMGSNEYRENISTKALKAEIKKENITSFKSFLKAGYVLVDEDKEYFYLKY